MPYMFYQQYSTAIKEAYANHDNLAALHEQAQAYRAWLQTLNLEPRLRNPLVEPIDAIERALAELLGPTAE